MFRTKLISACAALALLAAACGGGASDTTTIGGTEVAPTETTTTPPSASTTSVAPQSTTAPETTDAPTTQPPAEVTAEVAAFRQAVTETVDVTSAKMAATIVITGGEGLPTDTPVSMGFEGAFDNATGDFAFKMDLTDFMQAGAAGEEIPPEFADLLSDIEIRQIGDTAYLKLGFFTAFLGVETAWLSMPAEESESVGDFTGGYVPGDPTTFLDVFSDIDATVEDLGSESLRGVATTHYRVTIDVAAIAESGDTETLEALELQGPLPLDELVVDFWVGDDDLLYKFETVIDGAGVEAAPGEGFDTTSITFEIWDYNQPISVSAPDAADVTNVDDIDLSGLFGDL